MRTILGAVPRYFVGRPLFLAFLTVGAADFTSRAGFALVFPV